MVGESTRVRADPPEAASDARRGDHGNVKWRRTQTDAELRSILETEDQDPQKDVARQGGRAGETRRQPDGRIENGVWVKGPGERSHVMRGGSRRKAACGKSRMLLSRLSLTYNRPAWKSRVGRWGCECHPAT